MNKHTILFLAANPYGSDRLALDEETHAIRVEPERSRHRAQLESTANLGTDYFDELLERIRWIRASELLAGIR